MRARLINNGIMKESNAKLVLNAIKRRHGASRTELAAITGMTQASVTNIVGHLLEQGFLTEVGIAESSGGRKPIILNINPQAGYVVGIDLKVTEMTCVVTDFTAVPMVSQCEPVDIDRGKDAILQQLIALIERCIAESGVERSKVLGVGVASAGPYDYEQGIMINPPNFKGWKNVHIKQIVGDALGLPVCFEKEAPAAALAEYWFGDAPMSRSLFLMGIFDIGIGGCLVQDGSIYHGFKGGAAEIGHMTIDPAGKQCNCGNFGCLEAMADGNATLQHYLRQLKMSPYEMTKLGVDDLSKIDLQFLFRRAEEGDELCVKELERSANYIGIALQNVIQMFSPDTIVLAGEFVENCELNAELIIRTVRSRQYFSHMSEIKIYKTRMAADIFALGGVALVIQKYFNV